MDLYNNLLNAHTFGLVFKDLYYISNKDSKQSNLLLSLKLIPYI